MVRNCPLGNRLSSDTASRWLEWLAINKNGPRRGRCCLPSTRRPMNSVRNGSNTSANASACTTSRHVQLLFASMPDHLTATLRERLPHASTTSVVEIPHVVQKHGCGITQRIHPVHHAAVSRNDAAD